MLHFRAYAFLLTLVLVFVPGTPNAVTAAPAWTAHNSSCVLVAGHGPCYVHRGPPPAFGLPPLRHGHVDGIGAPPACLSDMHDPALAMDSLRSWFRITDFRRHEIAAYVRRERATLDRPVQIVLDGDCSNSLIVRGDWIVLGGNLLRPWVPSDLTDLLGPTAKISTIVIFGRLWVTLSEAMRHEVVNAVSPHLTAFGRIVLVTDVAGGGMPSTPLIKQFVSPALLAHSGYIVRHHTIQGTAGDDNDDHILLHLGVKKLWPHTLVVTATQRGNASSPQGLLPLCGGFSSRLCATKTVVVNLDRRPERWAQIQHTLLAEGLRADVDFERMWAVDGAKVSLSPDLKHLFRVPGIRSLPNKMATMVMFGGAEQIWASSHNPYNDHGLRRGVLGCSLSNLLIWRDLVNRKDFDDDAFVLVLEDDVWFKDDGMLFVQKWRLALSAVIDDPRWDWLYLGYSSDAHSRIYGDQRVQPGVEAFRSSILRTYGGGTFGYAIRKKGARKLLARSRAVGISQAIDFFMIDAASAGAGVAYKLRPLLVLTTGVLLKNVSDTTSVYPHERAIVRALNPVAATQCRARRSMNASAERILPLPSAVHVVPSGEVPTVVFRPSFAITPELTLEPTRLPDAMDEQAYVKRFQAEHTCTLVCIADVTGDRESPPRMCAPLMMAGSAPVLLAPKLGVRRIRMWMESPDGILVSAVNTSFSVEVIDFAQLVVTAPTRPTDLRPPFVLANGVDFGLAVSVYGEHGRDFAPRLYNMCAKLSSPLFATLNGVVDLGCRPLSSTLGQLTSMPFGVHTLTVWLEDPSGRPFGHSDPFSFHVVPMLPSSLHARARVPANCTRATAEITDGKRFDIIVLLHRNAKSFRAALASWRSAGLLSAAHRRLLLWNRDTALSPKDRQMLDKHGFDVLIEPHKNLGIGRALSALVRNEDTGASPLVLFLEEDWVIDRELFENNKNNHSLAVTNLQVAMQAVASGSADVVKLRSAKRPGQPYCSSTWSGYENLMQNSVEDSYSVLNAASWMTQERHRLLFGEKVWRTSPVPQSSAQLLCSFSSECGWTNNPWIASRSFVKEHVLPAAEADWTTRIEGAVNLTPFLWRDRCFRVCQMPLHESNVNGLFSHQDLDKELSAQSPCEVPRAVRQEASRRLAMGLQV